MKHRTKTNIILSAILLLSTVNALVLGFAGVSWQVNGYGLNPLIAYPLAFIVFAVPVLLAEVFVSRK